MPVGYRTFVDHLIFYSRVSHVYSGIKCACIDNYSEITDTLLWVSVCNLTLTVVVPHNSMVPPLSRNHLWRIFPLLKTRFRSWSEEIVHSLKDFQVILKSLNMAAPKREKSFHLQPCPFQQLHLKNACLLDHLTNLGIGILCITPVSFPDRWMLSSAGPKWDAFGGPKPVLPVLPLISPQSGA